MPSMEINDYLSKTAFASKFKFNILIILVLVWYHKEKLKEVLYETQSTYGLLTDSACVALLQELQHAQYFCWQ